MLKLIALGVGSAFTTPAYWQTNFLLQSASGKNLLIDCGSDVRHSLAELDMSYKDIDAIYISHDHADHVGGLEYVGFCRYKTYGPTKLYSSQEYCPRIRQQVEQVMAYSSGEDVETFFDITPAVAGFAWEEFSFQLVRSIHIPESQYASYGLIITFPSGKRAFLTTDTTEIREDIIRECDITFHDCETSEHPTGCHVRYEKLRLLGGALRDKIVPVHYNPEPTQNPFECFDQGFPEKGSVYEF